MNASAVTAEFVMSVYRAALLLPAASSMPTWGTRLTRQTHTVR